MKKILALLLAGLMVFALAACSGSGNDSDAKDSTGSEEPAATEAPAPQTIAEDTTAITLSFTPPESYDTVNRHLEYAADGSVVDKSFTYTLADKSEIIIGYTKGKELTDEIPQSYLDEAEVIEFAGKSFSVITRGSTIMGVCQDNDVVYGIGWSFADDIDRDKFDALMNGISFTDNTETVENGDDLYDIRYTFDSSLNVVSTNNNLTETHDGEAVDKSILWYCGKDKDNIDYRLLIKVFKNSTVEEQVSDYDHTGEVELGGVTYTAVYEDESKEKAYAYYTQHGEDVYEIRNMGVSSGWSTTRSDESYEALEKLMSTVSFA